MKPSLIIGVAATLVGVVGMATYLIATGHDPSVLITVMVTAVPLVAVLFGISTVQKQTNGNLSKLSADFEKERAENKVLRSIMTPEQLAQIPPSAGSNEPGH